MAAAAAFPAHAADWGQLATISSTLGVNANRLCVGEGTRSDIGCPAYAPYVGTTSGNVGIGTTNPNAKLEVNGSISATNFIGDGSQLTGIGQRDRITSGTAGIVANSSGAISVTIAGTERMVINSSGNVGIGMNAPSVPLEVSGTISATALDIRGATNGGPGAASIRLTRPDGSTFTLTAGAASLFTNSRLYLHNDDPFIAALSGNQAIRWFTLYNESPASNTLALRFNAEPQAFRIYNTRTDASNYERSMLSWRASSNVFQIGTEAAGTGAVRNIALTGGSVGIGTTAPQAALQVSGTFIVSQTGQTTTPTLYTNASGNVGIGSVTPSTALEVNGAISATALYVTATTGVISGTTVNGKYASFTTLTAGTLYGDGSGLTGITTLSDRITSGTTEIIANNNAHVSVTIAGVPVARYNSFGAVFASGAVNGPYFLLQNASSTLTLIKNGDSFINVRSVDNTGTSGISFGGAGNRGSIYGTANYGIHIRPNDEYNRANVVFLPTRNTYGMNVGIGTSSPQATLHVSGSFLVSTSGQINSPSLNVGANGNVGIGIAAGSSAALTVREVNGTQTTTITGNGGVLGSSNMYIDTAAATGFISMRPGQASAGSVYVRNNGLGVNSVVNPSRTLHVDGTMLSTSWTYINANVAVRVTPSAPLEVSGTVSATAFYGDGSGLTGITAASSDRIVSGTTQVAASQDRSVTISSAGAQRMVIGENGYVGIGTANPTAPLAVVNGGYSTVIGSGIIQSAVPSGYSSTLRMAQTGISDWTITNVANTGAMQFNGSSGARFVIASSGNIGIGTTSPSRTLDVSGTAQIVSRTLIGGTGAPSATLQVSGSLLLAGNDNIPCTESVIGLVRRNPVTGRLQACR